MKKLKISEIIEILDNENYTIEQLTNTRYPQTFTISHWDRIIKKLLNYYFYGYKIKDIEINDEFGVGVCLLRDKIEGKYINDLTCIEFDKLYSNNILNLYKSKDIEFNIDEFGILYQFLVDNSDYVKSNETIKIVTKTLYRILINYAYGAICSDFSFLMVNDRTLVTKNIADVFVPLFNDFPDNIIYIDIDTIYLDFLTSNIKNRIDQLNIPYTVDYGYDMFFIAKKKYIQFKNGQVKKKGLSEYKSKFKLEKERCFKLQKINNIL